LPDTTYSPAGWECAPSQAKGDSRAFCVTWKSNPTSIGILPKSSLSGFIIRLPGPDSLYDRSDWHIRFRTRLTNAAYGDSLKAEGELDFISTETGTISGRVTDERGAGIPEAIVFVWHTDLSARTERDGSYTISRIPVGSQSVAARANGFDPCNRTHLRIVGRRTTSVDFPLTPAAAVAPCVPFTVANDRVDLPFPGDVIDTVEQQSPKPKSGRSSSRLRAYINHYTSSEVAIGYKGLGQDTIRAAFEAIVNRTFRNPDEERLIRIAEETYPPAEAVLAIAKRGPGFETLSREKRLWWYDTFDGVRIPYAVTMDAVRYYLRLTDALGRGDSTQTGFPMKRSHFRYNARISGCPETYSRDGHVFKDVYLVEMRLEWSNYCGPLCACSLNLDRTVLIRPDGTVVCVFGDQKPRMIVS
jgi:hypothetical protein